MLRSCAAQKQKKTLNCYHHTRKGKQTCHFHTYFCEGQVDAQKE